MLLKQISLKTNNLFELHNFYKEIFELPTVYSNARRIAVTAGKSQLIFEQTSNPENPFYHFAFNIPSNKFEEAFNWMKKKTELLWLDDYNGHIANFVKWNAKSFYFKDPAGNILELITRFDLDDTAGESFSSMHIRNVSEIGLVFPVKSFDTNVNNLLSQYPLDYFAKQPPMPHFRALGDDEGLFVIVPDNRVWFSTKDTISQTFPMQISFNVNDISYQLKM